MILSDGKYLEIRGKLRDLMRDSRKDIPNLTALASEIDKGPEEKEQELLRRYCNPIDYHRAKEFYHALRFFRQTHDTLHCLGLTRIPFQNEHIVHQAEAYANEMRKIRRKA